MVAPKAATKALRYCAGGDPLDIADLQSLIDIDDLHGVKDDEVMSSVWDIVDAVMKGFKNLLLI